MQHLMLAIAIIMLTIIAGNGRQQSNADNVMKVRNREKVSEEKCLPVQEVESDFSLGGIIIDMRGI